MIAGFDRRHEHFYPDTMERHSFYPGKICRIEHDMPPTYTAFLEGRCLATGPLHEVAVVVLRAQQARPGSLPQIFSDDSGRSIDVDLRGGVEDVAARYTSAAPAEAPKTRGRPKLGVVAREVTLLPEQWDWLASQPGGASVTLRKLVHEARRQRGDQDRTRHARERAYLVMSALAGDFIGFEEASRAMFAGDRARLSRQMAEWPDDVRSYVLQLVEPAPA